MRAAARAGRPIDRSGESRVARDGQPGEADLRLASADRRREHAPGGEIVAAGTTAGDEPVLARCDLGLCNSYQSTTFNFARHREPEQYRMFVERKAAAPPAD